LQSTTAADYTQPHTKVQPFVRLGRACGEKQVAGEGDQQLVAAGAAADASKAVGEDAASEVTLELRDDEAGQSRAVASLFHLGKEFLQISADRLMKQSQVGLAAAIC